MSIWKKPASVEALTAFSANCAVTHLGIEFLEVGDDFIRARVPVDARTSQPYGLLHGGVSVVLAETLGSAAPLTAPPRGPPGRGSGHQRQPPSAATSGWVTGTARPFTLAAPRRSGKLSCTTTRAS